MTKIVRVFNALTAEPNKIQNIDFPEYPFLKFTGKMPDHQMI